MSNTKTQTTPTINIKYPVRFDPKAHRYSDDRNESFTSVTSLVRMFANEDFEAKCEQMLSFNKEWKDIETTRYKMSGKWQKVKGNIIHSIVENRLKYGYFPFGRNPNRAKFYKRLCTQLDAYPLLTRYFYRHMEIFIADSERGYAGTIDLACYDDELEAWIISDWKTGKSISKTGEGLMLYPFDSYPNSKENQYRLQLSLYRRLLMNNGNHVSDIMYLSHITPTGYVKMIPVTYMPEVDQLFQDSF